MSGKYDLDRDLALRGLEMKTKPGMSSLNEDDVRRICQEEFMKWKRFLDSDLYKELFEPNRSTEAFYPDNTSVIRRFLNTKPQATDTEPPAN